MRFKKACDLAEGIHDLLSPSTSGTPLTERVALVEYHEEAAKSEILRDHTFSPIVPKLAHIARSCEHGARSLFALVPDRVVDVQHIRGEYNKKGKIVGHHFAPDGSPLLASLVGVVHNPATGIFFGKVPNGKGGYKGSSFFPGHIDDIQDLLDLILSGKELARYGARVLYRVDADKPFYYNTYNWESTGSEVDATCFPIFDFVEVNVSEGDIDLGGGLYTVDARDLIAVAEGMLQTLIADVFVDPQTSPLQFVIPENATNPRMLVFDFAPAIASQTNVDKGLFVAIPIGKFSHLADLESILSQIV
jgi:hypothetical protein